MKPQLLAPAGNLEKLKWATAYGADAVYFGTEFGSLRSFAGNFDFDTAAEGIDYLHQHGKAGYATLNIYPFSDEYEKIIDTAKALDDMGVDAFIISDLGVLAELKKLGQEVFASGPQRSDGFSCLTKAGGSVPVELSAYQS